MSDKAQVKLGLALGCGGVKGVAHLGVIRFLLEHGVRISYLSGSSMGALIGALYAFSGDISAVEALFESLHNLRQGARLVDISRRNGMLKGAKVEAFLDHYLQGAHFADLRVPLAVVVTDLNSGQPVVLDSGPVAKAVRASISATPVFEPLEYGGRVLSDGGLSNPVPAAAVRALGARQVIAVSLSNGYFEQRLDCTGNVGSFTKRSFAVLQYNLATFTSQDADILLEPAIDNQSILGLEGLLGTHGLSRYIKAGYDAARAQHTSIMRVCSDG